MHACTKLDCFTFYWIDALSHKLGLPLEFGFSTRQSIDEFDTVY